MIFHCHKEQPRASLQSPWRHWRANHYSCWLSHVYFLLSWTRQASRWWFTFAQTLAHFSPHLFHVSGRAYRDWWPPFPSCYCASLRDVITSLNRCPAGLGYTCIKFMRCSKECKQMPYDIAVLLHAFSLMALDWARIPNKDSGLCKYSQCMQALRVFYSHSTQRLLIATVASAVNVGNCPLKTYSLKTLNFQWYDIAHSGLSACDIENISPHKSRHSLC